MEAYDAIRKPLLDAVKYLSCKSSIKSICITGHSQGTSLGTLNALDLALNAPVKSAQIHALFLASPLVGNQDFKSTCQKLIPKFYSLASPLDPICNKFLRPNMIPATNEIWLICSVPEEHSIENAHFIAAYYQDIELIEQLAKEKTLKLQKTSEKPNFLY